MGFYRPKFLLVNRRPRALTLCKGIILCIFFIIGVSFCVPSDTISDFHTIDGHDQEELEAGQSKSFFLRKEYSLTKPYQGSWNLAGSAIATTDFVRLTPAVPSHRGAITSRLSVHIRHWEARLNFRVHGKSAGGHFGDGLAFWYVDHTTAAGFPGPAFGGPDRFSGLVVTLDTYSNAHGPQGHFHPYVSATVSNGSAAFRHEDDGEQKPPVGCTASIRNRDHETLVAIRYVDSVLAVSLNVDNVGWHRCFRVKGVHLPTHYVFGISAMTGDLVDNHEIISMKVYEVESALNPDDYSGKYRLIKPSIDGIPSRSEAASPEGGGNGDANSGGSIVTAVAVVCLTLLGVAALAALVVAAVRSGRERRKKRFY